MAGPKQNSKAVTLTTPSGQKVQVEAVLVTPKLAETWLGKQTLNRGLRDTRVAAYARDIAAGNWLLTGESVKFAKSGRLIDAQHRLHAIIEADTPAEMLVVRGLDDEVQEVIDSGAARTAADALRVRGEVGEYAVLSSAARLAILYEAGHIPSQKMRVTHSEILDYIDGHPELRGPVELAAGWRKAIDMPVSVLALCIWRLSQVDKRATVRFFTALAEKSDAAGAAPIWNVPGSAVFAVDKRMREIRRSSRRMLTRDWVSLIFRAWNYFRTDTPVDSLPLSARGASVDIPEPK